MKYQIIGLLLCSILFGLTSCSAKKELTSLKNKYSAIQQELDKCEADLTNFATKLSACEKEKTRLASELKTAENSLALRQEQVEDLKTQRDKQLTQVDDLTVLSKEANKNIGETLKQLERKDKYIHLLQNAKTKADSINLALAVNLKQVLRDGIEDEDIEVKVDKTVVFVNLSDKMLYKSGSYELTSRAQEVLGKIAQIIQSRPELEVMVEGYTDNVPIKNKCIDDNWDLSVKRSTSVVRVLQTVYNVDPNRLIAAGRGEYNTLASNSTAEGRAINRRTRIIILPKLDQFYDLLNPNNMPK